MHILCTTIKWIITTGTRRLDTVYCYIYNVWFRTFEVTFIWDNDKNILHSITSSKENWRYHNVNNALNDQIRGYSTTTEAAFFWIPIKSVTTNGVEGKFYLMRETDMFLDHNHLNIKDFQRFYHNYVVTNTY